MMAKMLEINNLTTHLCGYQERCTCMHPGRQNELRAICDPIAGLPKICPLPDAPEQAEAEPCVRCGNAHDSRITCADGKYPIAGVKYDCRIMKDCNSGIDHPECEGCTQYVGCEEATETSTTDEGEG